MLNDPIETIAANSFRNFHARGLDYLCLKRSPGLTIKAYFFDDVSPDASEIICPHDHRYPFSTTVLAGRTGHHRFVRPSVTDPVGGDLYQRLEWRTPLNGGNGFSPAGEARLKRLCAERYQAGDSYHCRAKEIHTISVQRNAVIMLFQFADTVPIDQPTQTFVPGDKAIIPDISGLYDQMTIDQAIERLAIIKAISAV